MPTEVESSPEPGDDLFPVTSAPGVIPDERRLPYAVAALAVWPLLQQVMGFLVGFVDTALAGRLSVEATNAAGVATYIHWLMNLLVGAVGIGATALVARAVGACKSRRASHVLGQSLSLALLWGMLVAAVFYVAAPGIASISGLREESHALCVQYLRILSVAAPFSTVLGIGEACLRGIGDMRTPFWVMVLVNVINVVVSAALALPESPVGGWGLTGIAIGTLCAWVVGCAATLWALCRRRGVRLEQRYLPPRLQMARRIVRVGLPNLLENSLFWIGNYTVIMIIGRWLNEPAAIGAHVVAVRIEAMSYLLGFAMGQAAATLAGQCLGAGRPDLARRAVNYCWLFGVTMMTLLGLLFIFVPEVLVRLMTNQERFLELCPPMLQLAGFAQAGFGSYMVLSNAIRGAGDTRSALILTLFSTYFVRVPMAYLLGVHFKLGLWGVWVALCGELVLRGVLFSIYYLSGRWMRAKI